MFAGLISREQPVSAWGDVIKIMAALAPYSLDKPRDVWVTDQQLLLQVATRTDSTTAEIYRHPESGVAVAFWGRLDNRSDLIQQLEAQHKAIDDELIALAWLKWGEHCPEKLIGDFAFAVSSPKTKVVFLARDVMGIKPLFYRVDDNGVFFANSAAAFKPLQLGSLTPSREWMARYMFDLSVSHEFTAYTEIRKLPGAHSLLIQADGTLRLHRYHQFVDDAPIETAREEHWLEAYRAVWQESVACRLPTGSNVASENSGGLDSGSITAEIARQLGLDVDRLYGMGFCHGALEPEHIMATAMKWQMNNNFLCSGSDSRNLEDVFRRECQISGYPHEHGNGSSHSRFYEFCVQNQIPVMYSGFGGDEVVTSTAGMLRAELFDRNDWKGLWRLLPGIAPIRAGRFVKTALNAMRPSPIGDPVLLKAWAERWKYHYLRQDAIQAFNLESAYTASATYSEGFRKVNAFSMNRLAFAFMPTRLENCTLMAASYGIDYVWPLWDQRLVQQWLSTPSIWKVGEGEISRYLHRRAVAGVCPDVVVWKATKDMGYQKMFTEQESISLKDKFELMISLADKVGNHQLAEVIDSKRLREMACQGIKHDWRGQELATTLQLNNYKLESLIVWHS